MRSSLTALLALAFAGCGSPARTPRQPASAPPVLLPRCPSPPFCEVETVPLTAGEAARWDRTPRAFADRYEYRTTDPTAHVLFFFARDPVPERVELSLLSEDAAVGQARIVAAPSSPKIAVVLDLARRRPGRYLARAVATTPGAPPVTIEHELTLVEDRTPARPARVRRIPIVITTPPPGPDAVAPIATGIPLPEGLVVDPRVLTLHENGRRVPAQIEVRARWHAGEHTSVQWVGLDFLARWERGRPRTYELRIGPATQPEPPMTIRTHPDGSMTIDTGALSLRLDTRRTGRILGAVRPDGAPVAMESPPAWVLDDRGVRYDARLDAPSGTRVVVHGPIRTTVRLEGAFVAANGSTFCRFVTLVTLWRSLADVRIEHRVLLTESTAAPGARRIIDAAWSIATARASRARFGVDGAQWSADLRRGPAFLHQDRGDRVVLRNARGRITRRGREGAGWVAAGTADREVALQLRDFAPRFPKELEASSGALTVHLWPRHGEDEPVDPADLAHDRIHLLAFAHRGRALDLRLPAEYARALTDLSAQPPAERRADTGFARLDDQLANALRADGRGMVLRGDILVVLGGAGAASRAARLSEPAHALASPEWNVTSRVEAPMLARDAREDGPYRRIERALDLALPTYHRTIAARERGMWIHGDAHGSWNPAIDAPGLHRVWLASHYRNVSAAHLLYFRSGSLGQLQWARATTDHYLDVDVLSAPTQYDPRGAMRHVYGWLPWGAGNTAIAGHWIDADAMRWRWLLEGDPWAGELYRAWARGLGVLAPARPGILAGSPGREAVNNLGEVLAWYRVTRDPQGLIWMRELAYGTAAPGEDPRGALAPFDLWGGYRPSAAEFFTWHSQWLWRLWDTTRDPTVVTRAEEAAAELPRPSAVVAAFLSLARRDGGGDPDRELRDALGQIQDWSRMVYDEPGAPHHGYGTWMLSPETRRLQDAPFVLYALDAASRRAGAPLLDDLGTGPMAYPWTPSRVETLAPTGPADVSVPPPLPPGLSVLLLEPSCADQAFLIQLAPLRGFGDLHPTTADLISPFRRRLVSRRWQETSTSSDGSRLLVPPDGVAGLATLELRGHRIAVRAPYSGSSVREAALLPRDAPARTIGRTLFWLTPVGAGSLRLVIAPDRAATHLVHHSAMPVWAEVRDADGATVASRDLFAFGREGEVLEVDLDPARHPAPWLLYTAAWVGPTIRWTGQPEALLVSADPGAAAEIAAEIASDRPARVCAPQPSCPDPTAAGCGRVHVEIAPGRRAWIDSHPVDAARLARAPLRRGASARRIAEAFCAFDGGRPATAEELAYLRAQAAATREARPRLVADAPGALAGFGLPGLFALEQEGALRCVVEDGD